MMKNILVLLVGVLIILSACGGQQVTIKSATVDNVSTDEASIEESSVAAEIKPACVDTDAIDGNGRQPTWPGVVTTADGIFSDTCKDLDNIIEMRCAPNGQKAETVMACGTKKKCLGVGDGYACIPLTCRDRVQGMDEEGIDCGPICGKKCAQG